MKSFLKPEAKNALLIGFLCFCSYLAVYFARNILGVVSPQMLEDGFTEPFIGGISSVYFITYAVGQLINGALGDRIKARYMIGFGLILAGVCTLFFSIISARPALLYVVYAMSGFFLAMIFGPMTRLIAENTVQPYTVRCSLGYTFASFLGTPLAGVAAVALSWDRVFSYGGAILIFMGLLCFMTFLILERYRIIQYHPVDLQRERGGDIRLLIKRQIIRFTLVSMITGIIRTSVVFWLPTYLSQHLAFSTDQAALLFTVSTVIIAATPFLSIFLYERMGRKMKRIMTLGFALSVVFFVLTYFVHAPYLNVFFLISAIMTSNFASSMLWSCYCPGLKDTGMVSAATGFLDFMSYLAAAASNLLFANAVTTIGWGWLIWIWAGLALCGLATSTIANHEGE